MLNVQHKVSHVNYIELEQIKLLILFVKIVVRESASHIFDT